LLDSGAGADTTLNMLFFRTRNCIAVAFLNTVIYGIVCQSQESLQSRTVEIAM